MKINKPASLLIRTAGRLFNRLKILYTDLFIASFYRLLGIINRSPGVAADSGRNKRLIISLTSYPARFPFLHIVLESLLTQKMKPDMLVLWLYKEDMKHLPPKVLNLQKRGLTIRSVNEDLRSYQKLYYALEEFEKDAVIICDDDTLYPRGFTAGLYEKWLKYPDCIAAYRCTKIIKAGPNTLAPYDTWPPARGLEPDLSFFHTGVSGVLYPPGSLHPEVFNKDLLRRLSPDTDDIWFKACALLNGTKTVMVKEKPASFPIVYYRSSQQSALWKTNINLHMNDINLKRTFDYFSLYKLL